MPPRILVVTNCYPNPHKRYSCVFIQRSVRLHRESGLDVSVLTTGDSRQGLFRSSWKYFRLSMRGLRALFFTDYDLVHAHFPVPAGLLGMMLSRLRGKPFVLTSHGAFVDNVGSHPWLVRSLVRTVLRNADVVIAVGQEHRRNVAAVGGLPGEGIRLIDMGVWLPPSTLTRSEARQILNLSMDEKIVFFVGNLIPRKGVDILLRAASLLQAQGRQFRLLIGGQGPEEPRILSAIKGSDIEQVTTLLGPILPDDVFTWFSAADICVVPSRAEPFGLVAVEAMACGTAVVASAVGGMSENIRHGENGLLFPADDHEALAQCLRDLLEDDDLREHVAEQGRQSAAAFDMRLKALEVKQIYEELLTHSWSTRPWSGDT